MNLVDGSGMFIPISAAGMKVSNTKTEDVGSPEENGDKSNSGYKKFKSNIVCHCPLEAVYATPEAPNIVSSANIIWSRKELGMPSN